MVYYTRGKEVPTLYTIWSGLSVVSSVVKREAWFGWFDDDKLFSNLYIMICGPAGIVKKTEAIRLATRLIDFIDVEIADPNIAGMKRINPFTGKVTPERLITKLVPNNRRGEDFEFRDHQGNVLFKNGQPIVYKRTSEVALYLSEMSVTIGRSSYSESFLDLLLPFYDNEEGWDNDTQVRGSEQLRDLHTNLMAGLTPAALKESIPTKATGDGFLSRALVVYQADTSRRFRKPIRPEGAPSRQDMREFVAWIAANTFGKWELSPDADRYYDEWYNQFKDGLPLAGMFQGLKSRLDVILLKVSCCIRWQRPDRSDQLVHLQDIIDAAHLIKRTFEEATPIYRMIFNNLANDKTLKAEAYLQRAGSTTRRDMLQRGHIASEDATTAVLELIAAGKVRIIRDGKSVNQPSKDGGETYEWIEEAIPAKQKILSVAPDTLYTGRNRLRTLGDTVEDRPVGWTESRSNFGIDPIGRSEPLSRPRKHPPRRKGDGSSG